MNVYRAYIPTADFQFAREQNIASGLQGQRCQVSVLPGLPHKKVWAYLWATPTLAAEWEYDLVGTLNGTTVYRQKLAHWSTVVSLDRWYSGTGPVNTLIGPTNEQIYHQVTHGGNTALYVAVPWRLNLACDTFHLDVAYARELTGSGAAFDLGLFTMSQQGI